MSKIKFSVVVPLYNKEKIIHKCLQSIILQSHKPDEIIIINDGSTDTSKQIVESFINEKSDNIFLYNYSNGGVSKARNLGIKKAKNEFVALIDADDQWDKDFLHEMNSLIIKFNNASIFSSFHRKKDSKGNIFMPFHSFEPNYSGYVSDYFYTSIKVPLINSSSVILKKSIVLEVGGFPERAFVTEDLFMWFKIALNYKVAHLNKPLVTINHLPDHSRGNRGSKHPFIIDYFCKNIEEFNNLSNNQKDYLFSVSRKHLLGILINSNRRFCFKFYKLGVTLFGFKFVKFLLLFIFPPFFFKVLRFFKKIYRVSLIKN